MTTTTTRILLPGLIAAACASGAASADFAGASVEDVSEFLWPPPGLRTYRVYIRFDSPDDQLLSISGNQNVSALVFETNAPDGLVNAGGLFEGLEAEDFAGFPLSLPWDSWVTIDHAVFVGNDTDYSPGFAGSDGTHNVIKGTSFSQATNGGWFDSNLQQSPALAGSDLKVLIAQFTIEEGYEFFLQGTVDFNPGGHPPSSSVYFHATNETGPACDTTVEHVFTSPPTDIDGNGAIGFQDLLAVLGAWGPCIPEYVITGQARSSGSFSSDFDGCSSTRHIAEGFGRFAAPSVDSRARDDGMSLHATPSCSAGGQYTWGYTWSNIVLSFDVNHALPFTFFADVQWDEGWCEPPAGEITLTGPGLQLTAPVDSEGILAPGQYSLYASAFTGDICWPDGDCDAEFDYNLLLDGTRCAADVDRDGAVGWSDLLRVLTWWGLSTETGTCCLPDGSCTETLGYDDCLAAGGLVAGWGTWCDTFVCPPYVACCLPDGTCAVRIESDCLATGGVPQGPDTTCAGTTCPQPGACCLPSGGCEEIYVGSLGEQFCMSLGGVYLGDDVPCTDAECPESGACCLPDGSCVPSANGGIDCANQGGVYHGDDTLCADVVCLQPGACCLPDGACVESNVGGEDCASQGGVYHGDNTFCANVVCPQPGACCRPNGVCVQSEVGGDACASQGGIYYGDDTLCADVVCPQPGACCRPNGVCVQSEVGGDACASQGGIYYGDDTLCADVACVIGACCFPDWTCAIHIEQSCESAGGTFAGEDTSCAVVNCAHGACCLPDGSCFVLPPATCDAVGGTYQGGGSTCETVSCP